MGTTLTLDLLPMSATADQTLEQWLRQSLPPYVHFGESADIVALSAVDIPGPWGTTTNLADMVDETTYEHICLIFRRDCDLNLVKAKIAEYYRVIGYTINHVPGVQNTASLIIVRNDELDEELTVTILKHSASEIMVSVA